MYLMDLFQHWKGLQVAGLYGRTVTHGKHSIGYLGPPLWGKLTKKEKTIKFSQLSMKANTSDIINL